MKRVLKVFLLLLLLAAVTLASVLMWGAAEYKAAGPLMQPKQVMIAPGTGFKAIAAQLAREGVIANRYVFMAPALLKGEHRTVKAGEYAFEQGISPQAVMQKLVKGDVVIYQITIPEGLTVREVLAVLAAEEALTGAVPDVAEVPEGSVLPETYQFHRGDARADVLKQMQQAMETQLEEAWQQRAPDVPLKSKEEALILASIVEKETGVKEERRMVAGVYANRLRLGMMLQADPTVAYGVEVEQGAPMDRPLLRRDLQRDTPYNTYTRTGLPPTPIACPGAASIKATLNPEATDALFFVATGNGGHRFARTLEEHNRNVAEYRAVLRQMKAKDASAEGR